MASRAQQKEAKRALRALGELDGEAAANRAVERAGPDRSLIFLTRSVYEDLLARTCLPELKRYKGKHIVITSDNP
jgi:hypothetical protein